MDVPQALEDLLEELVDVQKAVNRLTTKSVSGGPLRKQMKDIYKRWLPISGVLESGNLVDAGAAGSVRCMEATGEAERRGVSEDPVQARSEVNHHHD